MESPGVVQRLAATLESGRSSHSYQTGAVLRHHQEVGQRSPQHGHYYKHASRPASQRQPAAAAAAAVPADLDDQVAAAYRMNEFVLSLGYGFTRELVEHVQASHWECSNVFWTDTEAFVNHLLDIRERTNSNSASAAAAAPATPAAARTAAAAAAAQAAPEADEPAAAAAPAAPAAGALAPPSRKRLEADNVNTTGAAATVNSTEGHAKRNVSRKTTPGSRPTRHTNITYYI